MVEELLKSGQLPCLVATSSLELGIDMGAVDLVIQVESPKSVTRGLQRIGRAGHTLDEVSVGRIFPKFRADLLECAVVARRMREGKIEETVIPRNPLDVLAQHLVSMCADDEWEVDEVERLVTGAEPFSELSREQLENVLDMLDGRYPSDRFAELRPRLVWDRAAGTLRGRPGARQLAVTNAGTIPDRGLYGVHLPDGRRVGELDEEMVYEARPGQTFLLGATTWRIEEITRDRVIVTPAPGVPGAVPFWKGDGIGRPAELGKAIGAFAREAVSADPKELAAEYDLDRRAAENLVAYLREQQAATRVVPSDETVVVERFRDEIGDWRLCVLSPWGGRVHAAWGLALSARIRDEHDLEADAIWSDDGIVVHLPDADEPPPADLVLLEADEVEDLVVRELGARRCSAPGSARTPPGRCCSRVPIPGSAPRSGSSGSRRRACSRSPRTSRGSRSCSRPTVSAFATSSTCRAWSRCCATSARAESPWSRSRRRPPRRSPPRFCSTTSPPTCTRATRRTPSGGPRRCRSTASCLRELLGQEELRELIDPEALAEVEDSLQHRSELGPRQGSRRSAADPAPARRPDLGRVRGAGGGGLLGRLDAGEARARAPRRAASASPARSAGSRPRTRGFIATRSACRRRQASRRRSSPRCQTRWWPWFAATRAPTAPSPPDSSPRRYGADPSPALRELERAGELVRGELLPGGTEREWCDPDVLRRLRRASLAHLRAEAEAVDPRELARFLPSWQNVDAHRPAGAGPDRLREALVPLQGVALTPEVWERDVLPRRLGAYSPAWLDELCTGGEFVWIGAGALGRSGGKVALYFREDVRLAGPPPANLKLEPPAGDAARRDPRAARPAALLLARPRRASSISAPRSCTPPSGTSPGEAR